MCEIKLLAGEAPTLDGLLAESAETLRDAVGEVTLKAVPQVLALYEDESGAGEVRAWVFTIPGDGPIVVKTDAEDGIEVIHAIDLESVDRRWSRYIGGSLTFVTGGGAG